MADPNTCDCCEGVTPLTPVAPDNLPGQAALAYRVGTHGQFKASMRARIAAQPALIDLTTRDDDDASIALIDAWATTLDVLTFYQERIINEGYLRTSIERASILELARSIGYELRPGVAASTYLAFELETAPGSPEKVTLPIGTKAQTIPGQDELPQTFETIEVIEARPEWNKLKAKTTQELLPVFGARRVYLQGVATQLRPGDGLLIVGQEREKDPTSERWDFRRVTKITPDHTANITLVEWAEGLGWSRGFGKILPAAQDIKVYAFRQRAAIFGANAPDWRSLPDTAKASYLGLNNPSELTDADKVEYPAFNIFAPVYPPEYIEAATAFREIKSTPEMVATAASTVAQTAASTAFSVASKSAMEVVHGAADLADTAMNMAVASAAALEEVATTAVTAVRDAASQVVQAQMSALQSLGIPSVNNVVDQTLRSVGDAIEQQRTGLSALIAGLPDPVGVAAAVLASVRQIIDDQRAGIIDAVAGKALDRAKAAVPATPSLGDIITALGRRPSLVAVAGWVLGLAQNAIENNAAQIKSDLQSTLIDGPANVFKGLTDSLDDAGTNVANTVRHLTDINQVVDDIFSAANNAVKGGQTAVEAAGNMLKSAADFAHNALQTANNAVNAAASTALTSAIAAAKAVNPVDSITQLGHTGEALSLKAKAAVDDAASAAGATQAALIVSTAVKVALDVPLPADMSRLDFVADVANLAAKAAAAAAAGEGATFETLLATSYPGIGLAAAAAITPLLIPLTTEAVTGANAVRSKVSEAVTEALKPIKKALPARFPQPKLTDDQIDLDLVYQKIGPQSWAVLAAPDYEELYEIAAITEAARAQFLLTGKTTRLKLKGENLKDKFEHKVRETIVFAQSEELFIAEAPDTSPITAGSHAISVQGQVSGLGKGRSLIVAGPEATSGVPVAERVLLERLEQNGARLVFQSNLVNSYQRANTIVHANVAAATHGETKTEVLGSGDASQPFQKFVLKQSPLTYTATDQTPSGSITTLAVRVNDVLWSETPSLYGLGKRDRDYVTRIGDDGKVTVMFGDGQSGARLPTGTENVQATYRVGTGLAGMVKANQISLLMTRPLGAKGVINPIAPQGAQDPETRDGARQNAPLTVLTLDRVVSLQDFEDFARAFGGIGKAQAVWLWDGERRIVHVTVAAANGGAVSEIPTRQNLRKAITDACDPTQQFRIDSYTPLTFKAAIKVKLDPAYLPDKIVAAITNAVKNAFAFAQRAFGQPVTGSEVIALIQHVEGVVYVDLDSLTCVERPTLKPPLIAQIAHWENKVFKPAELLTLSAAPNSLQITVI